MGPGDVTEASLPPLPEGYKAIGAPRSAAAPAATGPSATPPIPSGYKATGPVRAMPYGTKMSIHAGPVTMSMGPQETTGEMTQEEKLTRQRGDIIRLGEEMHSLYNSRLAPKLKGGKLSSTGQGLEYTETGPMRSMGYNIDPDVEDWIVKSGQFSQALNSYYAASGGGRGGVGYFGEVTAPHVPHPPQGLREVLGIWSPTGQQWDLQKQGDQLPILLHNLKRDQGMEASQTYGDWTPEGVPEGSKLVPHKTTRDGRPLWQAPDGSFHTP